MALAYVVLLLVSIAFAMDINIHTSQLKGNAPECIISEHDVSLKPDRKLQGVEILRIRGTLGEDAEVLFPANVCWTLRRVEILDESEENCGKVNSERPLLTTIGNEPCVGEVMFTRIHAFRSGYACCYSYCTKPQLVQSS